jgi:hypothetical protein
MKNFEAKPCWKNIPMYANLILSKEKCQIGFFDSFARETTYQWPEIFVIPSYRITKP